VDFIYLTENKL